MTLNGRVQLRRMRAPDPFLSLAASGSNDRAAAENRHPLNPPRPFFHYTVHAYGTPKRLVAGCGLLEQSV